MDKLSQRIQNLMGSAPDHISRLSGGCVGDVFKVCLGNGQNLVAKVSNTGSINCVSPLEGGLRIEGQMLIYLRQNTQLPIPHVHFVDNHLLLMDFLPNDGGLGVCEQTHAAELVAHLHTISTDKGFGFANNTVIGGLDQPNPWTTSWIDFFTNQRLLYMGQNALKAHKLPPKVWDRLQKLCQNLERWLVEPAKPALVHGDLWGGNVLSAKRRISGFIDPAIYFADAEVELAFTTLFNTFGEAFFKRYHEIRPIRPGFFEQRRDLYNLYPLLVHVRLFGETYVRDLESALRKFGF